jgi:hypothetical protein
VAGTAAGVFSLSIGADPAGTVADALACDGSGAAPRSWIRPLKYETVAIKTMITKAAPIVSVFDHRDAPIAVTAPEAGGTD